MTAKPAAPTPRTLNERLAKRLAKEISYMESIDRTEYGDGHLVGLQRAAQFLQDAEAEARAAGSGGLDRPRIVCLCGSTRFYDEFQQANYEETMAGRIVLSVGFYPHAKATQGHGEGVGHDSSEKVALDELHKRKIDLADEVYVLNVDGYIGDSTRSEIDYAVAQGKLIRYLMARCYEPECQDQGHFSGRDIHWKRAEYARLQAAGSEEGR